MARPRGNRWQADVIDANGKRHRKSFKTQAEAENFEAAILEGLDAPNAITLGPYIDEQFDALWGDGKSVKTYRINTNSLREYLGEDTLIAEIGERSIDDMIARMRKAGLANGTINRKLSALSKLLRQATRHRLIANRPYINFLPENGGRDFVVDPDLERKCLNWFDHMGLELDKALFQFLLYTGCRLGEAEKADRLDATDGGILFADRKSKKRNSTNTVVPLVGPALEGWRTACRLTNSNRPFGDALPRRTFYGHWWQLKEHLGLDEETFVPHVLRHTCCTRLVKAGVPLPKVMKWMGHKNIQTTMGYAHLIPKDLDDAADLLLKAS